MNARREGIDILPQSSSNDAKNSHYDTVRHHLQSNPSLAYFLVTGISIYFILYHFRNIPVSLARFLWDITVYLTPSRLVAALHSKTTTSDSTSETVLSMNFQEKSAAMQRILGLDNSVFPLIPRARSLSGLGATLLGGKDSLPPGLGNWDNSCYQNSIIQGLASLHSLAEFLEQNIDALGDKGLFSTHQALGDIIDRLNSAASYGQRLWTPAGLKSMSSWQQQDAQEYFSKVVDQIDYEVLQATRRQTRNLGLKRADAHEHVIGAGSRWEESAHSATTDPTLERQSLRNPLEGLLAQRVGCMNCGYTEGLSLIPFNCLTVPLGAEIEHDIRDCLHEYMDLEPIEGVECAKCTLLRAKGQLENLLKQIEEDKGIKTANESPKMDSALKSSVEERLQAVQEALEEEDFNEKVLSEKCHIPSKNRASSTKSRQAVIARPPKCLVVHINRSLFDEFTGMLRKNYAAVRFPKTLDLSEWCLGTASMDRVGQSTEVWGTDPSESMLSQVRTMSDSFGLHYELRAVVTHYGRHENGHYICYRKYSSETFPAHVPESVIEADGEKEKPQRWFRLSDEDVQMVSESNVMAQGGAFMLFYEVVGQDSDVADNIEVSCLLENDYPMSASSCVTTENMSTASTATEGSISSTSQATSVSTPEKVESPPIASQIPSIADVN
ncbi:hypothetical protein FE257_003282 [Aspergillus nanangensis]|uniref:ubiquitinyl hydrolase 1 n=1 Tax=Aspergillus nanangensis TaxID=2582783 RepID=A0AAD4CSK3_ASPNN|nr:hypothetical protein FE257_003282 [Aspergillus nanangensis]